MSAYDVKIKGYNELVRVENGTELYKKWEAFKLGKARNEVVSAGNFRGTLADISSFRTIIESKADNNLSEKIEAEYLHDLKQKRSLSPSERAKGMGFFRFVYWGFTGKKSEDVMVGDTPIEELAYKLQKSFFEENPLRIIPEPMIYFPIIKSRECNTMAIGVLENTVRQDKFAVAKL